MSKTQHKLALTSVICAVLSLGGMTSVSAAELTLAASQPKEISGIEVSSGGMYIVRLEAPAIATYEGGIRGYEATSAKANGQVRLNTKSKAAKKYEKDHRNEQKAVLGNASKKFGRTLDTKFDYQHAINGFALVLTAEEAKEYGLVDEVLVNEPEEKK